MDEIVLRAHLKCIYIYSPTNIMNNLKSFIFTCKHNEINWGSKTKLDVTEITNI